MVTTVLEIAGLAAIVAGAYVLAGLGVALLVAGILTVIFVELAA